MSSTTLTFCCEDYIQAFDDANHSSHD
jgi:hypothetical protein